MNCNDPFLNAKKYPCHTWMAVAPTEHRQAVSCVLQRAGLGFFYDDLTSLIWAGLLNIIFAGSNTQLASDRAHTHDTPYTTATAAAAATHRHRYGEGRSISPRRCVLVFTIIKKKRALY